MLALARLAGETAPLIFTTLGNNFWNVDPTKPMAAIRLIAISAAARTFPPKLKPP